MIEQSYISSNYGHVASIFLKLGEVVFECFVYKSVIGFPPLCIFFFFFFFFKAFFIPVKNEKFDEGHKLKFREQELNETKIQAPFCKKANLWAFDVWLEFFWNFYGKLELVKILKCSPGSNCFTWIVLSESANFWWKFWCIKNKSFNKCFKANHLAYIEPRWYGSRISDDCQQNLLSPKHDTSRRFLPVNLLKEQKIEDDTQRTQILLASWKMLETALK